eukprot:scaffold1883_cov79-Cylindrotheca_fusiformis.AAC.1
MAIIRKKGWYKAFNEDVVEAIEDDDSSEEEKENEGEAAAAAAAAKAQRKEEFEKANVEAYDQILMGCSGIPLGLVKRAKGNAIEAIKNLDAKYAQEDESNLTGLIQLFTSCKLEDTETDPDSWFLKLDKINMKMAAIQPLLGNLPEGYEDVKTKLHGKEASYSVRQIEREIVNKWKRDFQKDEKVGKDKAKNIAMPVSERPGGYKKFKGKCR